MNSVSATSPRFPSFQQWSPIGAVAGGIFVIDLFIPLGVAAGVLYIGAVLMSLRHRNSQLSLGTAVICSILTIIAIFASPVGGEFWKVLANRGLALFAIWTTTVMGRVQLQQAGTIQRQDKTMQDFMRMLPSACFSFDRQGTILSWNLAAERIYGYTQKEAVGTSSFELMVTPETHEETKNVISSIFQGKAFEGMTWHDRDKKGKLGWRVGNLFPVFDTQGQISYGVNFNIDISAQKAAESDLLTNNALLEALLDSATDAIYAKDREGKYVLFNKASAEVVGKPSEAIIGLNDTQVFGRETAEFLRQFDREVYSQGKVLSIEEKIVTQERLRVFSTTKSPLKDPAGKIIGLVGISRDITEQMHVQQNLLLTDRVFMASPDHISILDSDYRYRRVNPSYEKAFRKTSEELIGSSVPDLLGQEVFTQTAKPMLDRCFQGEEVHYEAWFTFPEDQHRYMAVSYLPLKRENQDVQEIVVISRDLTERKQVEQHLEESQAWIAGIVDIAEDAIIAIDKSQSVQLFNKGAEKIFGYPVEEIIGQRLDKLLPSRFSEAHQGHIQDFVSTPEVARRMAERIPVYGRRMNGTEFPAEASISKLKTDSGTTFTVILHDTTEQKLAEEALRHSERLANSTMNALTAHLCVLDETGQILTTNERWNQFARENEGHPEKMGKGVNYFNVCFQAAKNGEKDAETFLEGLKAVLTKQQEEFCLDYPCSSSEKNRWFSARVTRFPDPGPIRAVVSHYDITERKILEAAIRKQTVNLETEVIRRTNRIQELEQRRMQVEKLAALAQIAAGVAHEINNPLASISQSLILLKRAIPQEHPHFRYMAKVEDCIDRIAQITKHLYQLYRPSSPIPTPIDLRIPLHTAKDIMEERAHKYGIQIRTSPIPDPITASVPQGELTQVLCNLIQNAIEASPQKSTIDVSIATGPEALSILVVDQGGGVFPESASHIFEPFYTTKQNHAEGGMGLGLSISHSLVESMGGTLDFSTSIGQGSTFTITLPLT